MWLAGIVPNALANRLGGKDILLGLKKPAWISECMQVWFCMFGLWSGDPGGTNVLRHAR